METLVQDLRHTLRLFWRSPGFTASALLTLAVGIGVNTTMFGVVNGVLLQPLPYPEPDRIVRVAERVMKMPGRAIPIITSDTFHAWRDDGETLEQLAAYTPRSFTMTGRGEARRVRGTAISAAMLPLLRVQPRLGRGFTDADEQPEEGVKALLSHRFWRDDLGADPGVVGTLLELDGEAAEIVGVMDESFAFPDPETAIWVPFEVERPVRTHGQHSISALPALARLRAGVALETAEAEGTLIAGRAGSSAPRGMVQEEAAAELQLIPLRDEIVGEVRPALLLLSAAVGLVLFVAVANLASLLLARGLARRRELAVRAALGAGQARLVRQLLTESVTLAILGGLLGIALAFLGVRALPALLPAEFPRVEKITLDVAVLAFGLAASLATGILFGALPALQAARAKHHSALSEGSSGSGRARRTAAGRLRAGLVVTEIAVAGLLLVGGGILIRSFTTLIEVDPGYEAANLLTAQLQLPSSRYSDEAQAAFLDQLLEELNARGDVESAGVSNLLPLLRGNVMIAFNLEGRPAAESMADMARASLRVVSPRYLTALGSRVIAGRDLADTDSAGTPPAMVVNQSFAKTYLTDGEPLGQRVPGMLDGKTWEVVEIIPDIRNAGLDSEAQPEIYVSYRQTPRGLALIRHTSPSLALRTVGDPLALVPALGETIRRLDPQLALDGVMTMERRVAASVAQPRLYASLLGGFAATALLLAALGVAGVLGHAVEQRRREIGVRLAVGAQRGDIMRLVMREGMMLAAAGALLGLAAAAYATRLLESLLFGISRLDLPTFLAAPTILLAVAALAAAIPAWRAARVNPIATLREE